MSRFRLAFLSATSLALLGSSAFAADLPIKAPPRPVAPALYNWTGWYIGINGGGGWGRSDTNGPTFSTGGSFRTSGGLVGGTLGYNWQSALWVFGLETDIDWTNIRGNALCGTGAFATSCEVRNDFLGTFRGRLGYAGWDRALLYITGGLAYGNIKTNIVGFGSGSSTKAGWTLGGGIEFAIAGPWTAKVEYLYADLGRGGSVLGSDSKWNANIVRAGINYRF